MFRKSLQLLDENHDKVFCLKKFGEMLRKLPERKLEGERLLAEAYDIHHKLPNWSSKLIHCIVE